jgi:hypothetical protein
MHFHNGTTGSEQKFDRYSEAQDRQFEHAAFADVKERMLPINRSPEMTAAQERAKELRTRLASLEDWGRTVAGWAATWRNNGLDVAGVTVALDEAVRAVKSAQVKVHAEQMAVGVVIQDLQGVK